MDIGSIINATVLGIIQGLTEFIPVSSSGHLEVIPTIFGNDKPSTTLILFAHLGTLLALIWYFRETIWQYIQAFAGLFPKWQPQKTKTRKLQADSRRIVRNVIIASIPAGIIGLAVDQQVQNFYDSSSFGSIPILVTLIAMAVLGLVFILSDGWFKGKKLPLADLPWLRAGVVGTSQALAFIRGVSRSGISVIVGQFAGLSRVDAAKFSFLMSIPLITATSIIGIIDLVQLPTDQFNQQLPTAIAITISSAISGWLAIRFLLNYLEKNGLAIFGWYRIGFAVVAALLLFS